MKPINSATLGLALSLGICVIGAWSAATVTATAMASATVSAAAPATGPVTAQQNPIDTATLSEAVSETESSGLQISIAGVRNASGRVLIMVFDDAISYSSYDYEGAVAYQELPAQKGELRVNFPSLSRGAYAVSVVHDENGDYELNTVQEYPVEGYGTSNARSPYEELSFRQAAISSAEVSIRMMYLDLQVQP